MLQWLAVGRAHAGHADADGDLRAARAGLVLQRQFAHGLAQAVRHRHGAQLIGIGQQHGELLAAIARRQLARALHRAGQGLGHALQAAVARNVAVVVVVGLEIVHIDHQQRQRHAAQPRLLPLALHGLAQGQAVGHLGHRIQAHTLLQRIAVARQLLLGLLALGDVLHRAGHAQRVGIGAVAVFTPHLQPALCAVAGAHNAVLRAQRGVRGDGLGVHLQHMRAVLGVHHVHPLLQRHVLLGRQPKDGVGHAGHEELLVLRVVGEVASAGGLLRAVEPAHVALQRQLEATLAPPGPPLPRGCGAAPGQQRQAGQQRQGQPLAALGLDEGLVHVELGHEHPRRIRHRADQSQHLLPAVVAAVDHAACARHGLHHHVAPRHDGLAQAQRCVAAVAQRAHVHQFIAIALHQQRLGRAAGTGPALHLGKQLGARIAHQPHRAQGCIAVKHGREHAKNSEGKGGIPVQLHRHRLSLGQRLAQRLLLGRRQRALQRALRPKPQGSLGIHPEGGAVAAMLDEAAQPFTQRLLQRLAGRGVPARRSLGEQAVIGQGGGIGNVLAAPVGHVAHLQQADGAQAALDLVVVALLALLVHTARAPGHGQQQPQHQPGQEPPRPAVGAQTGWNGGRRHRGRGGPALGRE